MRTQTASNVMNDKDLQVYVIAESLSLPERHKLYREDSSRFECDNALYIKRNDAWKHAIGVNPSKTMPNRLKSLGITEDELPFILGKINPSHDDPIPYWWEICQSILDDDTDHTKQNFLQKNQANETDDSEESASSKKKLIPFEDALASWVTIATAALIKKYPSAQDELGAKVLLKEQRGLLENLSLLSRSAMLLDFETRKSNSYDTNDLFIGMLVKNPPGDVYAKYVSELLQDRWRTYMRNFPPLVRLLATRVILWINSLGEFVERIKDDRARIEETFSPGSPLGKLVKGGRGVSDSHNGARAVVVCEFENGVKIVYKPRSMSVDVAWLDIISWINSKYADSNPMRSLKVIDCGKYGWMEFADHQPCESKDEVATYYKNMGVLLSAIHCLQGNDFHLENVVANRSMPIAIDLETISVPEALTYEDDDNVMNTEATQIFSRSVLRTLLLPMAMSDQGGAGRARNLGAIGIEVEDDNTAMKFRKILSEINTDFMQWKTVTDNKRILELEDPMLNRSEVKLADGNLIRPQDYLDDLLNGYKEAYTVFIKGKSELTAEGGPLHVLSNSWVRILNRATNIYYRLLLETCKCENMSSGVDRWIAADRFCVAFEDMVENDGLNSFSAISVMEHEALQRGDIAYFLTKADSLAYYTLDIDSMSPVKIEGAKLKGSAINSAKAQIADMSNTDLDRQAKFIQSSYLTALISLNKSMHSFVSNEKKESESSTDTPVASDAELPIFAKSILDELIASSIENDTSVQWIDLSSNPVTETLSVTPMDAGLYSGRAGIALLFERASRFYDSPRYLEIARKSFYFEIKTIKDGNFPILSPSGMLATGGMLSALWKIGCNEGQEDCHEVFDKLLLEIGPRVIARDETFDVISGSAGLILILSRINDAYDNPEISKCIESLGQNLLDNSCKDHGGPSWNNGGSTVALAGFSHGMAGIALALLHAYKCTGRSDFKDTAVAAIKCEDGLRSEEWKNWADLRQSPRINFDKQNQFRMLAWCHGLPGIMLGRAASLQIEDSPIIREGYEFARNNFNFSRKTDRNHLCCGSSGIAEIARTVGILMNDQEMKDYSRMEISHFINAMNSREFENNGCIGMGMMQGITGPAWAALAAIDNSDPASHLMLATP